MCQYSTYFPIIQDINMNKSYLKDIRIEQKNIWRCLNNLFWFFIYSQIINKPPGRKEFNFSYDRYCPHLVIHQNVG